MTARALSLRRKLLRQLVPSLVLVWLLGSGFILMRSWDELEDSYVDQIEHLAHTLAQVLDGNAMTAEAAVETVRFRRRDRNVFVVVVRDGDLVLRSPGAPEGVFTRPAGRGGHPEYFLAEATARNGTVTILTGVMREEVRELTADVVRGAAVPMGLGLIAMVAILYTAITRALRPLDGLRAELEARQLDALDPVQGRDLPAELVPMLDALNHLLGRLRDAMARERRFVADASHELRTPLAAIRAQVDTIDRSRLDQDTQAALDQILLGVGRSTRLAQQLLRLARADARGQGAPPEVALDTEVTAIVSELFPMAVLHEAEIEVDAAAARIRAFPGDLDMLVGNLVENAIHHAGAAPVIRVSCGSRDGQAWLKVDDNGPGIAPDERAAVFERFRRGPAAGPDGAGLGLAIVASVAERLGAQVVLERSHRLGGLMAEIRFAPTPGQDGVD